MRLGKVLSDLLGKSRVKPIYFVIKQQSVTCRHVILTSINSKKRTAWNISNSHEFTFISDPQVKTWGNENDLDEELLSVLASEGYKKMTYIKKLKGETIDKLENRHSEVQMFQWELLRKAILFIECGENYFLSFFFFFFWNNRREKKLTLKKTIQHNTL